MFRLVAGARVDRFDYLDDFVFSPRVSFMIKPEENQTFRVSYNRAYRSPSVINNFLDVTIAQPINLGLFTPLLEQRDLSAARAVGRQPRPRARRRSTPTSSATPASWRRGAPSSRRRST